MIGPARVAVAGEARRTSPRMLSVAVAIALVTLGTGPAVATQQPSPGQSVATTDESPATPTGSPTAADSATPVDPPAQPAATVLTVSAPESGYIWTDGTLTATLQQQDGAPVVGAPVYVERWNASDKTWARLPEPLTTSEAGSVQHTYTVRPEENRFRTVFDGNESHAPATSAEVVVRALRTPTTLRIGGQQRVVDEQRVEINLRWTATDGRVVSGRVKLFRKKPGTKRWSLAGTPRIKGGAASVVVRPRVDTVWRAVSPSGVWYRSDASGTHRIDNVPPMAPVALPAGAPKPSASLPAQQRAVGAGINSVVRRIPNRVWRSMVGRSWHRGCPVGRSDLRLVRMNYWGFDGYRHRGEMVLHRSAAGAAVGAFQAMYQGRYPIRSMYRVDRFGWSKRLQGANDYRSMAADNTSAFNCRQVVGRPGVRSPHTYGDSIDLNPWENPYVSAQGTYPNSWWLSRSHEKVAWRSWSHPVVRAFGSRGFAWGGAYRDLHHFQR